MSCLHALLLRLRDDQSGITVIEVLVSAVVVALLSVGVLAGLDGSQGIANTSRLRSVASNLAQGDQERLRGLRASELSNERGTRTKTLRNVRFTIESRADWVSDSGTTPLCSGTRADYLRITSTVTWPGMGVRAVDVTSLVTPPTGSFGDEGALGVQIGDRDGTGVAGLSVSLTGPETMSGTTDPQGCVFFGYLQPGAYQVSFSRGGYIDPSGQTNVSEPVTVSGGEQTSQPFRYDRPGIVRVSADARRGASASPIAAKGEALSLAHNQLPSGIRSVAGAATPPTSVTNLFPFTDPYSVFSGDCTGANPASYSAAAPATSALPAQGAAQPTYATVLPGGSANVTVREIALRVQFRYGSSLLVSPYPTNAKLTAKALGCGGTTTYAADPTNGWLSSPDVGVPVGRYDICIETNVPANQGLPPGWYTQGFTDQLLQDPNGVQMAPTGSASGPGARC